MQCPTPLVDEVPVHHLPPRLHIGRPGVAPVDVVRMLPHIAGHPAAWQTPWRKRRPCILLHNSEAHPHFFSQKHEMNIYYVNICTYVHIHHVYILYIMYITQYI